MTATARRPIAEGVFTWPSEDPRLLGTRCGSCATVTFPVQDGCPRCGADDAATVELGREGTLWTWTTQGFLPKHPYAGPENERDFAGYLVGYVELPGEVRVETRLVGIEPADVRIGMAMELTVVPFRTDPDGAEILTYAFRPGDRATAREPGADGGRAQRAGGAASPQQ